MTHGSASQVLASTTWNRYPGAHNTSSNADVESHLPPDVVIAVHALGSLRNRPAPPSLQLSSPPYAATPALSASTSTAPSSTTETQSQHLFEDECSDTFVSRVAEFPIVNTAIRAYDFSKANSRVVKFGAEIVESSVLSMTKPICDRLPVNQVNEFACRQLDRLSGRSRSSPFSDKASNSMSLSIARFQEESAARSSITENDEEDEDKNERSPTEVRGDNPGTVWQNVLLEAGGFSAAISSESVRRLQYCLQWLQYATNRVDQQILALQKCINSQADSSPGPSSTHTQQIYQIKADLLLTIRQVVEIISKYAGGALPEPARSAVRNFVLRLPQRWATANANAGEETSVTPTTTHSEPRRGARKSRGVGRTGSRASRASSVPDTVTDSINCPTILPGSGADKLLMLATESLDMLRNVTGVFIQSLERAENWVERLRVVGIDRQSPSQDASRPDLDIALSAVGSGTPAASTTSSPPNSPTVIATKSRHATPVNSEAYENSTDSEGYGPPKKAPKMDPCR